MKSIHGLSSSWRKQACAFTAGPAAAAGDAPAAGPGAGWNPDQDSPRFTLAVMPDHTTGQNAPLNNETFKSGFTIEAFVNIPLGWDSGDNSWMSVLSRRGEAGQAGKTGQNTDQNEPERQPWR